MNGCRLAWWRRGPVSLVGMRLVRWRLPRWLAALVGLPVLVLGMVAGVAQASGSSVKIYPGINSPFEITAGPDGALWFTNRGNNSIGRITADGRVTGYTGTGIDDPGGIAAGPDGALWFTNAGNNSIGRIATSGTPGSAVISSTRRGPGDSDHH